MYCEQEVDECDSSPCLFTSTCLDRRNGFICECELGWKGTLCGEGVDCDDDPCRNGGVCNYTHVLRTEEVSPEVATDYWL